MMMTTDNAERSVTSLQSDSDRETGGVAGAEKDEAFLRPKEGAANESEPRMADSDASEGLRMGKFAEIRQAVGDGSYRVDSLKVADKLIEHMIDLSRQPSKSKDPLASNQYPKQQTTPKSQ
jgi:anti-sigma28 factor (negative regulator of flagellin synthesis)